MPTARELLEQAEALIRRNRTVAMLEPVGVAPSDETPPLARGRTKVPDPGETPLPPEDLDDIPLLTDAVEDFEAAAAARESEARAPQPADDGEPSIWSDADDRYRTITGPEDGSVAPETAARDAPETAAALPVAVSQPQVAGDAPSLSSEPSPALEPVALAAHGESPASAFGLPARIFDDAPTDRGLEPVPPEPSPAAAPVVASAAAPVVVPSAAAPLTDDERWDALAEEIRMQVLQRIDIFTDTGLKEQLKVRLQPIVDRASADLVAAINQHVGQLLREYVAEAIEREILKWRAEEHVA